MSTTTNTKTFLATSATAMIGLLAWPTPAHALPMFPLAPACSAYAFPGNMVIREVASGWTVSLSSTGQTASGRAVANYDGGQTKSGNASGSITGNRVVISIAYDNSQTQGYLGNVDGNGHAHGTTENFIRNESGIGWDIDQNFTCLDAPAPAVVLPGGGKVDEPEAPVVITKPPEEKKPLSPPTITSRVLGFGFGGRQVTVKDNSGVASNCTYTSSEDSESFDLPANGSTSLNVGLATGETVNVKCDNGTTASVTF